MKDALMKWFGLGDEQTVTELDPNRAAAALMVEVMAADNVWDNQEANTISGLLEKGFNLGAAQARELLDLALADQSKAHDYYQFTSVINQSFDNNQKFDLLVRLWRVAYSDGKADHFEEHVIRKLADLLNLAHSDFIRAKIQARDGA